MWKCLKLLRFFIQTTEKLFMPNVTFDSNKVFDASDSRPAGSWYICQIGSELIYFYKHASRTIRNKFNVI